MINRPCQPAIPNVKSSTSHLPLVHGPHNTHPLQAFPRAIVTLPCVRVCCVPNTSIFSVILDTSPTKNDDTSPLLKRERERHAAGTWPSHTAGTGQSTQPRPSGSTGSLTTLNSCERHLWGTPVFLALSKEPRTLSLFTLNVFIHSPSRLHALSAAGDTILCLPDPCLHGTCVLVPGDRPTSPAIREG